MLILLLRAAVLLLLLLTPSAYADGEAKQRPDDARDRSKQETTALIATVLRDHVPDEQPCIFAKQWSDRAVNATLARQYLGISSSTDVRAPDTGFQPADIIDPTRKKQDHFCSDAEANDMWSQQLAGLGKGARTPEIGPDDRVPGAKMQRVDISIPIFDAAEKTAIVIISFTQRTAFNGQPSGRRHFQEGAGYYFVYRKTPTAWIQIQSVEDYTFH